MFYYICKKKGRNMNSIHRKIDSAYYGMKDRIQVHKGLGKNATAFDKKCYEVLVKRTGPATHNISKELKSWKLAYNANSKRLLTVDAINAQFKKPSVASKIMAFIARCMKR